MNPNQLTIQAASKQLESGQIKSVDLVEACCKQIESFNPKIKACLLVDKEGALKAAYEADKMIKANEASPLCGIPFLVKDNILTKGLNTTAASKMLDNYIAPYDATVVKKLKEVGAVLLGKTNLDEFAHGASTEFSAFGPTHNPWDLERVPGGSSGGSAAAVAADMCLFALGTDTGGSVRHPASFCGVVGYKPSYGLASRFGLIAMTSSTDVPGVLAKTAGDASLIREVMAGEDPQDLTTAQQAAVFKSERFALAGLKIGLVEEFMQGLPKEMGQVIRHSAKLLKDQGADIIDVSLPHAKYGVSVYYIITPAEISSNLARFDGLRYGHRETVFDSLEDYYKKTRGSSFGAEVKRRLMLGTYTLSAGYYEAYYKKAQQVRTKIIADFDEALAQVDLIMMPTTPHQAFRLGEQQDVPLTMYLEDKFLTPASLAGLPAVSLPVGLANDLPLSLQLVGQRWHDEALLYSGQALLDLIEPLKKAYE